MQAFRLSIIVTLIAFGLAACWGYLQDGGGGALQGLTTAALLAVIEISLSFDNAVVNAGVLRHWTAFWQKLFMSLGMLIAVFGMRLLFPLLIVALATKLDLLQVAQMALQQPAEYAQHLNDKHAEVAAFGGAFLLLVFLQFIFDSEKDTHWLPWVEQKLSEYGSYLIALGVTLAALALSVSLLPPGHRSGVILAGVAGLLSYVAISFINHLMEIAHEAKGKQAGKVLMRGSIGSFCYLELLDASFSFDGVIGAFAISNDIVLILLGLTTGAMFVRSMTLFLVRNGTLTQFVYLEHGAHYAVGILALLMFASVKFDIPEWVTGLSGVVFIALSLWSSILYSRRQAQQS